MFITTNSRLRKTFNALIIVLLVLTFVVTPAGSLKTASANSASYIVQGVSAEEVARLVETYGGTVTSRLYIINGVGASLSDETLASLRNIPQITAITPNSLMEVNSTEETGHNGHGNNSAPATDYADVVGADAVWANGVTGQGVTVAILDSGIDKKMDGLKKKANSNDNRIVDWADFVTGQGKRVDPSGHGTHVAGVIANSQVGQDEEWNGIAPDVDLVIGRVADENGFATYERVVQGVQWVIEKKEQHNIRVLNFSMSSTARSPYWADPVNQALMQAWQAGIVVVVAAGNGGPSALTMGVPGNNPYVVTVGSFTDAYTPHDWSDDYIPTFSSAGPTLDGFVKPDLIAPGGHIISLMPADARLAQIKPENWVAPDYFTMAGTSQSAAVVSGIAALMLSEDPGLTPNLVKHRLRASAIPQFFSETNEAIYSVWQQGAGRAFAPLAVFANIAGDPANAGFDIAADLANEVHYFGYSYKDD